MAGEPENKASWEFEPGPGGSFVVYERPRKDVYDWPPVVCSRNRWDHRAEDSHRHGRMIAAARDLYEALGELLDLIAEPNEIVREHGMDNALQKAADAIAKATGKDAPE